MGGTRLIILDVQDQGRNFEELVDPTRSCLIVLDVQDQGRNSEESHLIVLNV